MSGSYRKAAAGRHGRAALLCLPALALAATLRAAPPSPATPATPPTDPASPTGAPDLRPRLLAGINAARAAAAVPPLRELAALDLVAQQRAEEIGERGALPGETDAPSLFGQVQRRMGATGYRAHLWTESVTVTAGDAAAVVAYWRDSPDLAAAMRREISDLGLGMARFRGVPLYVLLFAWPEPDAWSQEAEPLRDLTRVRVALLAAVNAERRAAGRPPLAADARLDAAAQAHAEDMLARSYYAHESPEGTTPRSRVEAAGCNAPLVAENIAARHLTAERAMAGWMSSSDHRRNLLDLRFTALGAGVAVGTYDHRYQVLWVLDLARLQP
jgi:uncharacterized protein YkwD